MVETQSPNPVKVKAGRIGGRKRWSGHDTRVIHLDALTPPQRRLVLALVSAAKADNEGPQAA